MRYPTVPTGLTRPIPAEAMPVVEILRRDVPRPTTLPVPCGVRGRLAWIKKRDWHCCAMGLPRNATSLFPGTANSFGYENEGITDANVEAFADWFDEQVDAQALLDAIWPTEDE